MLIKHVLQIPNKRPAHGLAEGGSFSAPIGSNASLMSEQCFAGQLADLNLSSLKKEMGKNQWCTTFQAAMAVTVNANQIDDLAFYKTFCSKLVPEWNKWKTHPGEEELWEHVPAPLRNLRGWVTDCHLMRMSDNRSRPHKTRGKNSHKRIS